MSRHPLTTLAIAISGASQFLHRHPNLQLRNLINPFIPRHIQPILVRNIPTQKPPADKMPLPLEKPHTWLRSRQRNKILRHEIMPDMFLARRTRLDIPRRWDINCQHGDFRPDDRGEDLVERRPHGRSEAEPEERVDYQVGFGEGEGEVFGGRKEGDLQVVELFLEAGEDGLFGGFWVVDLGDVAVVVEVAGADEAVASWGKCQ
jgi:hypothetical protein